MEITCLFGLVRHQVLILHFRYFGTMKISNITNKTHNARFYMILYSIAVPQERYSTPEANSIFFLPVTLEIFDST